MFMCVCVRGWEGTHAGMHSIKHPPLLAKPAQRNLNVSSTLVFPDVNKFSLFGVLTPH